MKTKLIRRGAISLSLVISCLVMFGQRAHAIAPAAATSSTQPAATSYQFVAKPGDNLTYIVRRSIQLFTRSKQIKLSPAAAIYCETNVVQKIGSHSLNVGEHVSVPFTSLQNYISSSRNLTKTQLANWSNYVSSVSFDLNGINPVNVVSAEKTVKAKASSLSTNNTSPTSAQSNNKSKKTVRWYGWIAIAAFVLGSGYFFTKLKP